MGDYLSMEIAEFIHNLMITYIVGFQRTYHLSLWRAHTMPCLKKLGKQILVMLKVRILVQEGLTHLGPMHQILSLLQVLAYCARK